MTIYQIKIMKMLRKFEIFTNMKKLKIIMKYIKKSIILYY